MELIEDALTLAVVVHDPSLSSRAVIEVRRSRPTWMAVSGKEGSDRVDWMHVWCLRKNEYLAGTTHQAWLHRNPPTIDHLRRDPSDEVLMTCAVCGRGLNASLKDLT